MGFFGPSKNEVWGKLADEVGGDYQEGGFFTKGILRLSVGEWEIVLDTYTVSNGNNGSTTYTRMRAPFVNKSGIHFEIYREGLFSPVGRWLGMQDIIVGDSFFDDAFVIKSDSEQQVKKFLSDKEIKRLIHAQSKIRFEIRDDEGFFSQSFPKGVDELYFDRVGVLNDLDELKVLFELFTIALERLVELDMASAKSPNIRLK